MIVRSASFTKYSELPDIPNYLIYIYIVQYNVRLTDDMLRKSMTMGIVILQAAVRAMDTMTKK